jgi:hypothetical protein
MSNLMITCDRCGMPLEHHCSANFKEAIYGLLKWVPEGRPNDKVCAALIEQGRESGWIDDDEDPMERFEMPFFGTQAWSYMIFPFKDDARSFHSYIKSLLRNCGVDAHRVERDVYEQLAEEKKSRDNQAEFREKRMREKREEKEEIAALLADETLDEDVRVATIDTLVFAWGKHREGAELTLKDFKKYIGRYWEGSKIDDKTARARISFLKKRRAARKAVKKVEAA